MVAGAIILELTPVGWIATIAVAVGEGLAYTYVGKYIEHWSEDQYKELENNYKHWL